jgi:uncharacterized lipoprotein
MKRMVSGLCLVLFVAMLSGCSIFNGGCKCPKVSYSSYPNKR